MSLKTHKGSKKENNIVDEKKENIRVKIKEWEGQPVSRVRLFCYAETIVFLFVGSKCYYASTLNFEESGASFDIRTAEVSHLWERWENIVKGVPTRDVWGMVEWKISKARIIEQKKELYRSVIESFIGEEVFGVPFKWVHTGLPGWDTLWHRSEVSSDRSNANQKPLGVLSPLSIVVVFFYIFSHLLLYIYRYR